jgi:hypothetical protein
MAFLDNSGDIILDAVLTDIGRKRMADGTFAITKFGLGDDDINYQLFNKSHPSGSAYYDLEILQSPVKEATTMTGQINYGLLDITNLNLLYLPSIKANPGTATGRPSVWTSAFNQALGPAALKSGVYYVAANATNRSAYIEGTGMMDTTFTVSANNLFINGVQGPVGSSNVTNSDPGGSEFLTLNLGFNSPVTGVPSTTVANYGDYAIAGCADNIVGASKYSIVAGPRGTFTATQFAVAGGLDLETTVDQRYYDYGKVNQNLFADGNTYDYIDTTVYITGDQSGATIQLPIRIIRKNS